MYKFFLDQSFKLIDFEEYNLLVNKDLEETKHLLLSTIKNVNYSEEDFLYFEMDEEEFEELKSDAITELESNDDDYIENYILNYSTVHHMKKYFFLDLSYMLFKKTYDMIDSEDLFKKLYIDFLNQQNYLEKVSDQEDYMFLVFNNDGSELLLNEFKKYKSSEVQYLLNLIKKNTNKNIKLCLKKIV